MDLRTLEISDKEKKEILGRLRILNDYCDCAENLNENNVNFLKEYLLYLIGIVPIKISPTLGFSFPFQRFVINQTIKKGRNERLNSLEDLRYPRRDIAHTLNYNRASLKGQTIFYAGYGSLAVATETQPITGQLVTESKWEMKPGKSLKLLIICQDEKIAIANPNELLDDYNRHLEILDEYKDNTREVVVEVYKLITKAYTRKVNPLHKQGYLLSALLSNWFFTQKDIPVDAIYYPSVANEGASMNIAIKPDILDEKFRMIKATEYFVERGPRGWMNHPVAKCKSFNGNTLELNWENCFIPESDPIRGMMKNYGVAI